MSALAPDPVFSSPDDGRSADPKVTPVLVLIALGVLACGTEAVMCWTAGHLHADATLQTVARFLHVAALIVGFGAVLAVDWIAVLWLAGRRRLTHILDASNALATPIWVGLAGLTVTGTLLRPDLDNPLTLVKLGLVLAVTLNGLYAHGLGQRLTPYRNKGLPAVPRRLLVQSGIAATVSQVGWWGSALIGFINSQS
ncbi:hypothetical protein [Streptomyces sp. NPDC048603]|uniref:hypothetical protein n=1 Tax=Streptomyces sp. NPDC048603 TaxID=3365577 RepID=UPI0037202B85